MTSLVSPRTNLTIPFPFPFAALQLLPREGVVDCYVLKNAAGKVTDMISFYHLPSSVLNNPKHDHLEVAYSYYNVATTVPLMTLMKDMLIIARNLKVHYSSPSVLVLVQPPHRNSDETPALTLTLTLTLATATITTTRWTCATLWS